LTKAESLPETSVNGAERPVPMVGGQQPRYPVWTEGYLLQSRRAMGDVLTERQVWDYYALVYAL
jgi:hypothetical protein